MAKFIATQIKDLAHSGDGTEVTFTVVTKHAGEMVFTMPASGLADFKLPKVASLQRQPRPAASQKLKGCCTNQKNGSLERKPPSTRSWR